MFNLYRDLLGQELSVLKLALVNEKEKRRSILGADGKKLQVQTEKSSILMKEVANLASRRNLLIKKYASENNLSLEEPMTLSRLCTLVEERAGEISAEFCETVEAYRNAAFSLKQETEENGRRLTEARDTIHRLLNSLVPEDKTYGRDEKKQYSGSVILNANA